MAMDTTRDLLLYELAVMREVEYSGRRLFDFLALRSGDSHLVQIFRSQQANSKQLEDNIESCLRSLSTSVIQTPAESVGGIIERFAGFLGWNPKQDILDQFAVDTAVRYTAVCIAAYTTLIDWAILLEENHCVRCLQSNIKQKQRSASELEQFSHELGMRLFASVNR